MFFQVRVGILSWLVCCTIGATSVRAGNVATGGFRSPTLGREIQYMVYFPTGYSSGTLRYPVLYLLHGRGDSMQAWLTIRDDLDRLIETGRVPPIVAVMPDAPWSQRASYYIDSEFTGAGALPRGEKVETAFTSDLLDHVDSKYRTYANRSGRVIGGYSMGGYGAMRFALVHPELFGAAILLSPAVYKPLPPRDASVREFGAFGVGADRFNPGVYWRHNYPLALSRFKMRGLPLKLFVAAGDGEAYDPGPGQPKDDLGHEAQQLYRAARRMATIDARFQLFHGGHNWETWRPAFIAALLSLFPALPAPSVR
jgi:enterochelin esterase-like enzyme